MVDTAAQAETPARLPDTSSVMLVVRPDERVRGGEREQRFERLYRRHRAEVLAFALRRADAEVAHEVVADTFLVAWRRLEVIPGEPLPWLLGVARRSLANTRRAARRQEALVERVGAHTKVSPGDAPPPRVIEALARLRPEERETLLLVAWDDLRPAEAARVVGCSPVAFRIRLHRARRALARSLAGLEQEAAGGRGARPVLCDVKEERL